MNSSKSIKSSLVVLMLCFFTMGIVDLVGVATNFIKKDFNLNNLTASLIPMMVFLWFAIFSIPSAVVMDSIGRKNTVLISIIITSIALIIPYIWYDFTFLLISFALVGIANTFLQVSLNPLVSNVVAEQNLASTLTFGQFVKAIASFTGPILASFFSSQYGDWTFVLFVYSIFSIACSILLYNTSIIEQKELSTNQRVTFSNTFVLLKSSFVALSFFGILVIVGIDVCMNTNIALLLSEKLDLPVQQGAYGISIYFAAKTLGAFVGAFVLLKIHSTTFLKWSMLSAFLGFFLLIGTSSAMLLYFGTALIGFSCANVFSIIFSNVLNYNKLRANELSSLMIMGVAGGAIITPIAGYLSTQFGLWAAFILMFLCACYLLSLSIFLYKNILLFLLVIISIGLYGQKQNNNNTNIKRGEELFNIVWEKFRVPQYGLFAEYYPNSHKPSLTYFHQQDKQAKEVSFLWPMSGVFSSVNILLEVDSAKYRPYLDSMVYAVELYLDTTRFPKGYQAYPSQFEKVDRYYDDNGLVGIDYVDAYMLTNNEKYLTKAKEVMAFIESGWSDDLGGGATWLEGVRDQKPACTNGKATVLALKLYNSTQDTRYLNYGLKSYNWMMSTLFDDSLHIIWNSLLTKDQITSQVQKHPYTYNTGTMIQSAVHLYKVTSNEKYLRDAQKMAEGAYNFFFERLDNGIPLVKDIPWFTVVLYRGFEDLYLIDKDPKYINTIRECLDWAWDHARDAEGLPYRDWTGRNKNENKNPKWLLDASCMIELYTRVGILENLNLKSK